MEELLDGDEGLGGAPGRKDDGWLFGRHSVWLPLENSKVITGLFLFCNNVLVLVVEEVHLMSRVCIFIFPGPIMWLVPVSTIFILSLGCGASMPSSSLISVVVYLVDLVDRSLQMVLRINFL